MISAMIAKDRASNNYTPYEKRVLAEVEHSIDEAVENGQFSVNLSLALTPRIKGYIEELGYKVTAGYACNTDYTIIEWR